MLPIGAASMGAKGCGEPLEIHCCCNQERLTTHVRDTASDGSPESVPSLGLTVESFRAPAMALIELRVYLGPRFLPSSRA